MCAMPSLDELSISLKSAALGRQLWEMLLSEAERQRLGGDLEASWEQFGTIGMWLHVRGGSRSRAIVELAHQLDLITESGYQFLLSEIGEASRVPTAATPHWNRDTGELWYAEAAIRRIASRSKGTNVIAILDAFQLDGWPDRIDDPLPGGSDPQRLRDAVKALNRGLVGVRFRSDGTGLGVVWARVESPGTPPARP